MDAHLYVDGTAGRRPRRRCSIRQHRRADRAGRRHDPVPGLHAGHRRGGHEHDLRLRAPTQYGGTFSVNTITQDGYTTGRLIGIDIDKTGIVQARFTNGRSQPLGQVALANFANPQGLQQLGDTNWAETFASGQALRGQAGNSGFGLVQSGALEASNVDITAQLVNMITAQRNFQANAQMISHGRRDHADHHQHPVTREYR